MCEPHLLKDAHTHDYQVFMRVWQVQGVRNALSHEEWDFATFTAALSVKLDDLMFPLTIASSAIGL